MCIFSGKVESVKKTKIACIPLGTDHQIVIYENSVSLPDGSYAAMILPFPNGSTYFPVKALDKFPDAFKWIKTTFGLDDYAKKGRVSKGMGMSRSMLEIERIGSYNVSVAQNLDDLVRLDFGAFSLDPEVVDLLAQRYARREPAPEAGAAGPAADAVAGALPPVPGTVPPSVASASSGMSVTSASSGDYGFIVCQMRPGEKRHPIGYGHSITDGKVFVPTYHHHSHEGGHVNVDWDHEVYLFDINKASVEALPGDGVRPRFNDFDAPLMQRLALNNRFGEIHDMIDPSRFANCCRIDIREAPNMDLVVKRHSVVVE